MSPYTSRLSQSCSRGGRWTRRGASTTDLVGGNLLTGCFSRKLCPGDSRWVCDSAAVECKRSALSGTGRDQYVVGVPVSAPAENANSQQVQLVLDKLESLRQFPHRPSARPENKYLY